MKLSLVDYFIYLNGNENTRCVSEGEAVFNAGHIVLCGKVCDDGVNLNIYALCLQTSSLSNDPHEIKGVFSIENGDIKISSVVCSCKAGSSGKCKHISAVLIQCTRQDVEDMEMLSQTDVKCMWAAQKQVTKEKYKPVPIEDMPCFSGKVVHYESTDRENTLSRFIEQIPNSALAKHIAGRRISTGNMPITDNSYGIALLNNACQSIIMMELSSIKLKFPNNCCKRTYDKIFESTEVDNVEIQI